MTTPDLKEIIRVLRDYAMPLTGERLGERHPTICGWTWDEIEKEVSSRPSVTVAEAAKVLLDASAADQLEAAYNAAWEAEENGDAGNSGDCVNAFLRALTPPMEARP